MKLAAFLIAWALSLSTAVASLYEYPEGKRPAVSLEEAVQITNAMLQIQSDAQKYHIVRAGLLGDEKQTGDGAWTLYLFDSEENQVWAHIQLRTPSCSLHYYPHDYQKKGGGREIEFRRDGVKVTGPVKERQNT